MFRWLTRSKAKAQGIPDRPLTAEAAPQAKADELMRQAFPLHKSGNIAEAEGLYHNILEIAPEYADAHYLLGSIALGREQYELAVRHTRNALRFNNREPAFHQTLAESYFALGYWDEAAAYFNNSLELDPSSHQNWNNLGCTYENLGKLAEADRCYEKALEIEPNSSETLNNLAKVRAETGRVEEALAAFKKAMALAPDDPQIFSNYLNTLNFSTGHSRDEIYRAHLEYDKVFGAGRLGPHTRRTANPDPARKIKIAYFSPDLRAHPIWCFFEPVLAHHDRQRFDVSCYYLYPWHDKVSERLKQLSDRWMDCAGWTDDRIAEQIISDEIDILVDLAGHTGGNRLAVLARKPAPVIATWLGYPNTTGLQTVDYRITDSYSDPPDVSAQHYSEVLIPLSSGQWCFLKPDPRVPVTPLPVLARGHICFGSFNNAAKLTEEILQLWSEVLRSVDASTLLIWGVEQEQRDRVGRALLKFGIGAERVEYYGRTPFEQQLELHQRVDIALDTHPYSGVTTSFNALWMGVPILTLCGESTVSRSTSSILNTLGMKDWIALTKQEFVEIAVRKSADVQSLAQLRAGLRHKLEHSVLMDGAYFTRQLEDVYRKMWETHCRDTHAHIG